VGEGLLAKSDAISAAAKMGVGVSEKKNWIAFRKKGGKKVDLRPMKGTPGVLIVSKTFTPTNKGGEPRGRRT